jgi:hypothetical protein
LARVPGRRAALALALAVWWGAGAGSCSVTRQPPAVEEASQVVVVDVSPPNNAVAVPRYAVPSLTFSGDLDPDSLTGVMELRTGYFAYPGQIHYDIVDRVLSFDPIRLDGSIRYHFNFLGALDLLGRPVLPFGSLFFTGPEFGHRPAAPPRVVFSREIQPIFGARCALAGCHLDSTPGAFSLGTTDQSLASLVSVWSPESMRTLVSAGDASHSYLMWKLLGLDPLIYGVRMPENAPPLSHDELKLIARWIDEGAENLDGGPMDMTGDAPPSDATADGPPADATGDGGGGDAGADG